jgi:NAD(P)-dependent dehydrogenase (short-subunit alcohol dehydrogenase family)
MRLDGRTVVITGGGSGLGADACRLAVRRGSREVVVVDRDGAAAAQVAAEIGGRAFAADVTDEKRIGEVVAEVGDIDVWVHNAGIGATSSTFTADDVWQRMWQVHVMAIVYATRALLPRWL